MSLVDLKAQEEEGLVLKQTFSVFVAELCMAF